MPWGPWPGQKGTGGGTGLAGGFQAFGMDDMRSSTQTDLAVSDPAAAIADVVTGRNDHIVGEYKNDTERARTFRFRTVTGATKIDFQFFAHGNGVVGDVQPVLVFREVPPSGASPAWSANKNFAVLAYIANTNFLKDIQTITYATLGLTAAREYYGQLIRNPGAVADTLAGTWFPEQFIMDHVA